MKRNNLDQLVIKYVKNIDIADIQVEVKVYGWVVTTPLYQVEQWSRQLYGPEEFSPNLKKKFIAIALRRMEQRKRELLEEKRNQECNRLRKILKALGIS